MLPRLDRACRLSVLKSVNVAQDNSTADRQLFKGWRCTIACNGVEFRWESVAGKHLGFNAGTAPQIGTCNFTKSIQATRGFNPPMDVYCEAPAIQQAER